MHGDDRIPHRPTFRAGGYAERKDGRKQVGIAERALTDKAIVAVGQHPRHRHLDPTQKDVKVIREDNCTQRSVEATSN